MKLVRVGQVEVIDGRLHGRDVLREADLADRLGVGIAIPGLVDTASGTLVYAPNLEWRNVPLRQIFATSRSRLRTPASRV